MRTFLLISTLLFSFSLKAQFALIEKDDQYLPPECYTILKDETGSLSLKEVMSSDQWTVPLYKAGLVLPSSGTYWLHFQIKNKSSHTNWILEFPDVHTSEIEVYKIFPSGKTNKYPTVGFDHPFYPRPYDHKNYFFDIDLKPGEQGEFYIRINSSYQTSFAAYIRSVSHQFSYFLREYYMLGFFYGILTIMALYNLFLFLFIREKIYFYYVLYVITGALYTLCEDGIGFHFIWPTMPVFNHFLFRWSPFLFLCTFVLYAWEFLEFQSKKKLFQQLLVFALVLNLVSTSLSMHLPAFVKAVVYIVPFGLVYIEAIKMFQAGFLASRFFIAGFSVVLVSFVVFFFRMVQLVPTNLYTYYIFNLGMVVEVVMLSYALGDRFRIMKKNNELAHKNLISQLYENEKLKDKVNRELEDKVVERTLQLQKKSQELMDANEKLKQLTDQLNAMNVSLDKDNWNLKNRVKEETRSRILHEKVSYEEYLKIYPTDFACLSYLEELKWAEGYTCRKCGNLSYSKGERPFTRKCTKCKYTESVSAGTLFHGIKFPLNKAFYIAYEVCSEKERSTIDELSAKIDLRRVTVWLFRKKVLEVYNRKTIKNQGGWESILLSKD